MAGRPGPTLGSAAGSAGSTALAQAGPAVATACLNPPPPPLPLPPSVLPHSTSLPPPNMVPSPPAAIPPLTKAFPQKPPPVTVPGSDAAKPTGSGMSEPALEGEEETPTSGVENPGKLEFADFVDFGGKGDAGDDLNDLFDFFDSLVGGGASGRGSGSGSEQQRESKKLLGRNNSSSNDRSSKHMEVSEGHEPFGSKSRAGRKFRSMEGLEAGTNTEYILVPADDGYNWRKYGQKMVKGCLHPRLYFRCTFPGCPVRKTEERADDGEVLERIYRGLHNHPPPGLPAKEIQEEEWETRSEQQQQQQQQQQELDASPPAADANSPKLSLLSYEGRHCHAMPGPVFSPPPAERNSPVAAGGDSGTLSTAAGSRNDNPGMCSFRLPGEAVAVNGVGHWVLH
ncbi:unnamed protein product [Closterium sp. NIES-64]|nr:unnamed protein product [Closterium sp. NIES-64]